MLKMILLIGLFSTLFISKTCMTNSNNDSVKSSIFWRISGNNLADTSYLYGTIHVQDKRVVGYGKVVDNAFEKAKILAVELEIDKCNLGDSVDFTLMKDSSLDQLLSRKQFLKFEKAYAILTGVSLEESLNTKPFFISANILNSIIPGEVQNSVDLVFIKQARKMGKTVVGLETLSEQVATIDDIPYSLQAKMLYDMINDIPNLRIQYNNLLDAYLNMDAKRLMHFLDIPLIPKEYLEKVVFTRNLNMVNRSEPLFKSGSTFIAVGAGHLFGDRGIVSLLKSRGYTVEPIKFKFR